MTDEEIEKALANHSDIVHRDCSGCVYRNGHRLGTYGCNSTQLAKDALDYINRLKAEKKHESQLARETLEKMLSILNNITDVLGDKITELVQHCFNKEKK